jgi:predicted MPP superfamily phosphohydrolase
MYLQHIKVFVIIKIAFILSLSFVISTINGQKIPALRFNKDGKFKIVQFTDVHLKEYNESKRDSAIMVMKTILESEKPDLVVLTGDIVTSDNVKAAWLTVIKPMIDAGIPWAVVFGNHDREHKFTNRQIMEYLVTLPYNRSQFGPSNIYGVGNYVLKIRGSKINKTKALLYCFDSNAYTGKKDNDELGYYDWINFSQIKWYREISRQFTKENNGKPFPALAFFHIPVPEYSVIKNFPTTVGDKDEDVSSPKINSGMYDALLESKDVMGVFVGHDHNNNYIGCFNNICLAYGCKTGFDAYGKLDKGARIIVLYEGERKFDSWIHTLNQTQKYFISYPESFRK